MRLLERKVFVVYRLDPGTPPPPVALGEGLTAQWLQEGDLDRIFGDHPDLRRTFRGFLAKGWKGLVVLDGPRWAGYSWITLPGTDAPPHLPKALGKLGVCWNFYAHAREGYRGRGLQRYMLHRKLEAVPMVAGRRCEVFTGTAAAAVASRKSQLGAGYEPCGVVPVLNLHIPKVGDVPFGTWDRAAAHPPLETPA